jgi:hypothetical protein
MKFGIVFLFLFALTLVEFATSSPEADPEPFRVLENVRNRIQQVRVNNQERRINRVNNVRNAINNARVKVPRVIRRPRLV